MAALRRGFLNSLVLLGIAVQLPAQLPPVTVPGGQARFDIGGRFSWWDQAFVAGVKREVIADFLRNPVDATLLPGLGESESLLRAVTGAQPLSFTPGRTTGSIAFNIGSAELGAAIGITSRITLFGTVPIRRVRVQEQLLIDSTDATAGFNPADPLFGTSAGASTTNAFLSELATALSNLNAAILAGQYNQDPARLAEAQATLTRGTALRTGLQNLLLGAPFLPLSGSPAGNALTGSIDSLRLRLKALDPDTSTVELAGSPALPTAGLAPGALEDYLTRSSLTQTQPFEPEIYMAIGDVEVGAAFAVVNGSPPSSGISVRSVLRGTVTLPTGRLPDPNSLFALGTGERVTAITADLVTDVMTRRFGARFSAGLTLPQTTQLQRRIAPPDQPIPLVSTLATVERQPGNVFEASFQPYGRIARGFSFVGGVTYWSKQVDRYTWAAGQTPDPELDPAVLAQGTKGNATLISAGFSFAHSGVRRDGRVGLPLDGFVRAQMVVGSTEGRVPANRSVVFGLRVYGKVF
jgi:hypothetical protein